MLLATCLVLLALLLWMLKRRSRYNRMLAKFPGPRPYPIVGNALQMGTTPVATTNFVRRICQENFGTSCVLHAGSSSYILLTEPDDIEKILSSTTLLDKGHNYDFVHPWLGTGLLTATGAKWKKHRKILTPTFHFKILEEFVEVFNENGTILVDKLKKEVGGPGFDIHKHITLYAIDTICETAMGVKQHVQSSSESEYVQAVKSMNLVIVLRSLRPWYANDFIFKWSGQKRIQDDCLKILHSTTNSVIKSRKETIRNEKLASKLLTKETDANQSDGVKKRLAFLDLLIESTYNGSGLTDQEIREEVDTFMFAGHDTTAAAISFTCWVLSWEADIQEKVFQELQEVFPDPDAVLTFRGLQELKYMERVIKEVLRLYPSVPVFVRKITEDVTLTGNLVAPKGASIGIVDFMTHRNPEFFPDPEKFDPDRFLPDAAQGRHPYAYIPFSAGPRNCIGQKFAMLEMKSAIAHILRAYKLIPGTEQPDLKILFSVVLSSETGTTVRIVPRE